MLAELREELTNNNEAQKKIAELTSFPEMRPIRDGRVKATFCATQHSLDLFNKAIDEAFDHYGMTRYKAAALILETAIKRLGIDAE